MKLSLGINLLISCFIYSCANGSANIYHADTSFTSEERNSIWNASLYMATLTGGEPIIPVFDNDLDETNTIVRTIPSCRELKTCESTTIGSFTVTKNGSSITREIQLEPDLSSDIFELVVQHEIGHSYGFVHHPEAGLMNPAVNPNTRWTQADVDDCHNVKLCPDL